MANNRNTERSLSNVKLFFVRTGGKDLPISSNWSEPFGYNYTENRDGQLEAGEAIFKHSITDVLNNFDKPITMVHKNELNDEKTIQDFLIFESSDNLNTQMININSEFWNKVVLLLELININEATWREVPSSSVIGEAPYSCRGDELLRTEELYNSGTYGAVSDIYVKGSLNVSISSATALKDRILRAEFSVNHPASTDDTANEASTIRIDCYFNPDTFINIGASKNYTVYTYEDLSYLAGRDGLGEIDDSDANKLYTKPNGTRSTEFDAGIVNPIHEILKKGKYKSYRRYSDGTVDGTGRTDCFIGGRVEDVEDNDGYVIGKRLSSDAERITQVFYIFTSLDEDEIITNETMLTYIREYINAKYPTDEDKIERNLRYPNMFSDTVVEIYPVITNKNNNIAKNPIDGRTLSQFFNGIGKVMTSGTVGFAPWEMFYVGSPATFANSYRQPLIAFENTDSSFENCPISSRFPNYRPFDFIDESISSYTEMIRFHNLCIMALTDLFGEMSGETIVALFGDKTITGEVGADPVYTADLNWTHQMATVDENTGSRNPEYVQFTYKSVTYKFINPTGMVA